MENNRVPGTPQSHTNEPLSGPFLVEKIESLNDTWGLHLPIFAPNDSPMKRQQRAHSLEEQCVHRITFLYFTRRLQPCIDDFEREADRLYKGWVYKPQAAKGVIPESTRNKKPRLNDSKKREILECLFAIVDPVFCSTSGLRTTNKLQNFGLDDSPIPISLPTSAKRRTPEDKLDEDVGNKKIEATRICYETRWPP